MYFLNALKTNPSFTIVNIYPSPILEIYHFDFYRLNDASELTEIGFEEYVQGDGHDIVESHVHQRR